MSGRRKKKVGQLLSIVVGEDSGIFSDCGGDVEEEWKVVKKGFHRAALAKHPDKNGDPAEFRELRTAFEVLRDMYEKGQIESFGSSVTKKADAVSYERVSEEFEGMATPSWEYYAEAAEEAVPIYRAELAKSGRSNCKQTGAAKKCIYTGIAKGELRLGSLDADAGSYSRWQHLMCWRVPNKVWKGLSDPDNMNQVDRDLRSMNEVLLCGFAELPVDARRALIAHVMDRSNWTREIKAKKSRIEEDEKKTQPDSTHESESSHLPPLPLVAASPPMTKRYQMPLPGVDGAQANILAKKTVVLTGVFPELGGGAGLNLGKDKAKALCQRFGARVTSSISGKTDILLVGKDPGFAKVSAARSRGITLVTLHEITKVIKGQNALEDAPPLVIKDFSSGYSGNSLANIAPQNELLIAQGLVQPVMPEGGAPLPKPVKHPPRKNYIDDQDEDSEDSEHDDYMPPPKKKTKKPPADHQEPPPKKKAKPSAKPAAKKEPPPETSAQRALVTTTTSRSGRTSRGPAKYGQ